MFEIKFGMEAPESNLFLDALRQQELTCTPATSEHEVIDNKSIAAKRRFNSSVAQDFDSEDDCPAGGKYGKKTRGRVKVKMQFIDNKLRRYTTFSKRKTGIMKKAYELSTLTGTQVMLLVASETGHVYTFATRKLQPMITSESGKALIQTCLNSPDNHSDHMIENDSRMNPNGFQETELTYLVADDDMKGEEEAYLVHGESSPEDMTQQSQTSNLDSQINSHQNSIESQLSNLAHITDHSTNNQPELRKQSENLTNSSESHQPIELCDNVTTSSINTISHHSSTDALLGQQSLSSSSMSSRIALPQKSFDEGLFLQAEPMPSQSPPALTSADKSQKLSVSSEEQLQKQLEQQKALIQQLQSQHAAIQQQQQNQRFINPAALLTQQFTQPQHLMELQQNANINKLTSVSSATFLPTHLNTVNTGQTQLGVSNGQTGLTTTTAVSQSGGALFYHSNPSVVLPGSNPQTMIPEGYLPVINISQTTSLPVQPQQQYITIPLPLNNSQGLLQQVVTNQLNPPKS